MSATAESVEQKPYSPAQEQAESGRFYVVAPRKFLILMIGTLGLYSVYWFYKNWSLLNQRDKNYWPVMRGVFNVFFTHALFREVNDALRRNARTFVWSADTLATSYVICAILTNAMDRLAAKNIGSPITDVLGLVLMIPVVFALYTAQGAINTAEGDPAGSNNSRLTAANGAWLAIGALLWVGILLGLFAAFAGPEEAPLPIH